MRVNLYSLMDNNKMFKFLGTSSVKEKLIIEVKEEDFKRMGFEAVVLKIIEEPKFDIDKLEGLKKND